MEKVLYCLKKKPHDIVRPHTIENTLEALQEFVDGYIETVTIAPMEGSKQKLVIICNDEGRYTKHYNCAIDGIPLYGKILIVGVEDGGEDGDEFASIDIDAATFGHERVRAF